MAALRLLRVDYSRFDSAVLREIGWDTRQGLKEHEGHKRPKGQKRVGLEVTDTQLNPPVERVLDSQDGQVAVEGGQ